MIQKTNHPHFPIWEKYDKLYEAKFGTAPCIAYQAVTSLTKEHLKNHSVKGLVRIVELFFEEENTPNTVYDLKAILSSFFINKYSPKLKLDPKLYANADEWNKEVY